MPIGTETQKKMNRNLLALMQPIQQGKPTHLVIL